MVEDPLYECYLEEGVCDYDYYVEGSGYDGKDDVQPHQIVTQEWVDKVCSEANAEYVKCAVWEPTNTEYIEFNVRKIAQYEAGLGLIALIAVIVLPIVCVLTTCAVCICCRKKMCG